jgi:DNA (cytosine-5)-methyltransferase 1
MELRYGELFSGPGGLAYGAMEASAKNNGEVYTIRHQWATDNDHDACETYILNICDGVKDTVYESDIRELELTSLAPIDILAFGFPCNDYSVVGERKGFEGEFGPLYTYGVKALEAHNPICFVAENVSGLTSANEGEAFGKILYELQNAGMGYGIHQQLYRFEQYGIPQKRHRIIIVGFRNDLEIQFTPPIPTTPHVKDWISAYDALQGHPIPESAPNQEPTNHASRVVERLNHIKPGDNAWSESIPDHLRLNVKRAKLSMIYRRLHPNKPAYTVTGSGGGGTHIYHWSEPRALTNRERARLQTFPDDFEFVGKKQSVRRQIGMAVPPLAGRQIIAAVLQTIANNSEKIPDLKMVQR